MRLALTLAGLLALAATAAPAEARTRGGRHEGPRNVVLADLGLHVIGIGLQRTIGPRLAAQLALDSYTPWTQNENFLGLSGRRHEGDATGVVARGRLLFYPRAEPPAGPWLSPFGQVGPGWATVSGERRLGTLWAAGLSAGYGWLFAERWTVGVGGGVQYHGGDFDGGADGPSYGRWYPTLDLMAGYCF